jgi:hypothetical protein
MSPEHHRRRLAATRSDKKNKEIKKNQKQSEITKTAGMEAPEEVPSVLTHTGIDGSTSPEYAC